MENFQLSGTFKLRGAYYKIDKLLNLDKNGMKISIVLANRGNFALAC